MRIQGRIQLEDRKLTSFKPSVGERVLFKAAIILPMESPPVFNGGILVEGDRITQILQQGELQQLEESATDSTLDFEEAVIAPVLINLHTHIEYSLLKALNPDAAFFPWVRSLMEASAPWQPETWRVSAH